MIRNNCERRTEQVLMDLNEQPNLHTLLAPNSV